MAALSVCLLLDDDSSAAVRALWQRLAEDGLPSLATYTHGRHVPHLTLASLGDAAPADVVAAVAQCPAGPTAVVLQALTAFTRSRCSLAPAPTSELLGQHRSVHGALTAAGLQPHRHYAPGRWLPHVALAPRLPVDRLSALARRAYEVLPMDVTLTRLAIVDTGTGAVTTF